TGTDKYALHRCTTAFCTAASAVAAVGVILVTATTSLASSAEAPGSRARPPGQARYDASPPPSAAHTAAQPSSMCRTRRRRRSRSHPPDRTAQWGPAPRAGCCHAAGPCPPEPCSSSWPHPSGPPHEPRPRCPPARASASSATGLAGYRHRGSPPPCGQPLGHLPRRLGLKDLGVKPQVDRHRRPYRGDNTKHLTGRLVDQLITAPHILPRIAVHRLGQLGLALLRAHLGTRHHPLQRCGLWDAGSDHPETDTLLIQPAHVVADSFCPLVGEATVPQVAQHAATPPLFGVGLVVGVHHIRWQTAARRNFEPLLFGPRADLRCRRPRMFHAFLNWLRLLRAGSSRLAHRGPFSELHLKLTLILGAQLRLNLASRPFPTLMLQLPQGLTCHRLICGHPPLRAAQPVQQAPPCGRLMLRNRLLLTRPPHPVRRGDLLRCRVLHDPAGHGVLKSDRQANRLPGSSRRRGQPQHHPATVAACPLRA